MLLICAKQSLQRSGIRGLSFSNISVLGKNCQVESSKIRSAVGFESVGEDGDILLAGASERVVQTAGRDTKRTARRVYCDSGVNKLCKIHQ